MTKRVSCRRETEPQGVLCKCPSVAECRFLGRTGRPFPKQTEESQRRATLTRRNNHMKSVGISLSPIRGASSD